MAEFKHESGDDPFKDHTPGFEHDNDRSERTLGQICAYATAHMAAQFRSEVFSLLVLPKYARILRWDRAGVIVTAKIEFAENSGAALLADFFWRYQNMTQAQKGHDEDIDRFTHEQVEDLVPGAAATLGANKDSPFFVVRYPTFFSVFTKFFAFFPFEFFKFFFILNYLKYLYLLNHIDT
jgi:hypothetical protein